MSFLNKRIEVARKKLVILNKTKNVSPDDLDLKLFMNENSNEFDQFVANIAVERGASVLTKLCDLASLPPKAADAIRKLYAMKRQPNQQLTALVIHGALSHWSGTFLLSRSLMEKLLAACEHIDRKTLSGDDFNRFLAFSLTTSKLLARLREGDSHRGGRASVFEVKHTLWKNVLAQLAGEAWLNHQNKAVLDFFDNKDSSESVSETSRQTSTPLTSHHITSHHSATDRPTAFIPEHRGTSDHTSASTTENPRKNFPPDAAQHAGPDHTAALATELRKMIDAKSWRDIEPTVAAFAKEYPNVDESRLRDAIRMKISGKSPKARELRDDVIQKIEAGLQAARDERAAGEIRVNPAKKEKAWEDMTEREKWNVRAENMVKSMLDGTHTTGYGDMDRFAREFHGYESASALVRANIEKLNDLARQYEDCSDYVDFCRKHSPWQPPVPNKSWKSFILPSDTKAKKRKVSSNNAVSQVG